MLYAGFLNLSILMKIKPSGGNFIYFVEAADQMLLWMHSKTAQENSQDAGVGLHGDIF